DSFTTFQIATASTLQGQFRQLVFPSVTAGVGGRLEVRMTYAGLKTGWTAVLNGMEVRDTTAGTNTVQLITFTGVAPLAADGLTTDTYTGTNAPPNALLTVTTTHGTMLPPADSFDLDPYLQGVQVLSDSSGTFTFRIARPSGTGGGIATITAWDVGGRSYGTATQTYTVAPERRFDFNTSNSPTAPDYLGVLPDAVSALDVSRTGYGWSAATPVRAVDAVQSIDLVRRDFHVAQIGTFQIQVTPGVEYSLRALFGEPIGDVLNTTTGQLGGSGPVFPEGSSGDAAHLPTSLTTITITAENGKTISFPKPWLNVFQSWTLVGAADADNDGILNLTFTATTSASNGVSPYFALAALAVLQGPVAPADNFQLLAPDAATTAAPGEVLSLAALGPIFAEARARWQAFGLTEAQLAALRAVTYGVTDLPGLELASADAADHLIVVDQQAAGRGWFLDPTPWEDSEYVLGQPPPGADLLTVVMHEMGHTLGFADVDSSQHPEALMALQLMPAEARRVPTGPFVTRQNPVQPLDVNGDGHITPLDVLQLRRRVESLDPLTREWAAGQSVPSIGRRNVLETGRRRSTVRAGGRVSHGDRRAGGHRFRVSGARPNRPSRHDAGTDGLAGR
ncbi:MAG: hypothetical protein NTY19_37915, partial [Planctomycetota bacterium]|nr:hypothetical protein [Planctomycetota bacterium]